MSKYNIPTLADDQLEIAASAEIGAETRVSYSFTAARRVGTLEMSAPGDGSTDAGATLTLQNSYEPDASEIVGENLVLISEAPVKSAVDVEIVLACVLAGGTVTAVSVASGANPLFTSAAAHKLQVGQDITITGMTGAGSTAANASWTVATVPSTTTFTVGVSLTTSGTGTGATLVSGERTGSITATLTAPAQSQDQSSNLPQGIAVDFTESVSGATVRSVTSVTSVTGCSAGSKFAIMSLPARTSFIEIAGVTAKTFDPPSPKAVEIPDGYDSAAWVKRGRQSSSKLELKSVSQGGAEGLNRINGHSVTILIERRAEGAILTERHVFGNYRPTNSVTKGDGDTASDVSVTGMYGDYGCFC